MRSKVLLAGLLMWAGGGCGNGAKSPSGAGGAPGAGAGGSNGVPDAGSGADASHPGSGGVAGTGGAGGAGAGGSGATDAGGLDARAPDAGPADSGTAIDAARPDAPRADAAGGDVRDGAVDVLAGFAPCPADGSPCIVMPLGDSITEGFPTFQGGYRVELFRDAVVAGKNITFVGRRANGPPAVDGGPATVAGKVFPTGVEGYSGFTIDDEAIVGRSGISPLVQPAITMFHPHIILLMIGTNDVDLSVDLANAPTRLGALIDRITTAAPATLLVVAQITPTGTDATNLRVQTYNAAMPALIQQRASAGKHVLLVDMYGAFTAHADYRTSLMVDNLHPNTDGYALLGQTWYAAIASFLPAAR